MENAILIASNTHTGKDLAGPLSAGLCTTSAEALVTRSNATLALLTTTACRVQVLGFPEGGHTFEEFRQIMRTGVDMDHLHPTCPKGTVNASCVPFPFDGDLLQIMPWSIYKNMSDHDLRAIYEYLSAVPCIAGPPAPDPRHNDC